MTELRLVSTIFERQAALAGNRALLVGISGIDAAGKGFISARIAEELKRRGLNVAVINVDGWLNLPSVRFQSVDPAAHFYQHAIRFDELFEKLIDPLKESRSIELEADFAEETATAYRKHVYSFKAIDVVLLEGIFLFKQEHRQRFDLAVWIDCSFETARYRAVRRAQEGLPPGETIRAFETIYFPAQRIHIARDNPRALADVVLSNESRTPAR